MTLLGRNTDRLGDLARSLDDTFEIDTFESDASDSNDPQARMTELYSSDGAPGVIIYNAVMARRTS